VKELTYLVEGYRVGCRWDASEVEPIIRGLQLPNFALCQSSPDAVFSVSKSDGRYRVELNDKTRSTCELDQLGTNLAREIQLEVATHAPETVFVHAGVVRYRDGLVVIPGKSFSGKSTLVSELCKAGAGYYSDEYAVVTEDGRVRAWPRPLTLRTEDYQTRDVSTAEEMGWKPHFGSLPVSVVVVTRFEEEASWEPEPISAGKAVLELISNTVSAQIAPQRAMSHLSRLVVKARCLKGPRGEAAETARLILGTVDELYDGAGTKA
jgi:hypothetical protein